jgi:hypothetical protein
MVAFCQSTFPFRKLGLPPAVDVIPAFLGIAPPITSDFFLASEFE